MKAPGKMTAAMLNHEQSAENMAYVRRLLKQEQPGFAATLELAADLVGLELGSPKDAQDISQAVRLAASVADRAG